MREDLTSIWCDGLSCLLSDEDLISFYAFFTIIFAECAYLWGHVQTFALPFTIILLGYVVNVIVFAWLKGNWSGTKLEVLFTVVYTLNFVLLFLIGCYINPKVSTISLLIPFVIAAIAVKLRNCFYTNIKDCYIAIIHLLVAIVPFLVFTLCVATVSTLPIVFKFIIPILYAICVPFIPCWEDYAAAQTIFELFYEISWSKEKEKRNVKSSKH